MVSCGVRVGCGAAVGRLALVIQPVGGCETREHTLGVRHVEHRCTKVLQLFWAASQVTGPAFPDRLAACACRMSACLVQRKQVHEARACRQRIQL